MKHVKLLLLTICLFSVQLTIAQTKSKHALIIGIGNYPEEGGWPTISSVQDIPYIDSALSRQGFTDIRIIKDAQATKKGIEDAFEKLTRNIVQNSGDIVVIHVSSHGEQIQDDNGDEADGLDECIVTYNAVSPEIYNEDTSAANFKKVCQEYLRDDEFGELVDRLRSKLGKDGDVIVFMDNCHSGSGTRGLAKVRGGKPPLVSSSFDPSKYSKVDTAGVFKDKISSRGNESNMATFVVVSAAKAEELDTETDGDDNKSMGPLSYAVSKVFNTLGSGTTYRGFFAKIQSIMNSKVPGQHPVLEGNGIDRIFLGGAYITQKPYFNIEDINDSTITVKGGVLSGLDVGAKVDVDSSGTIDPEKAKVITTGIVIKASNYNCEIKLDKSKLLNQAADGWVFVTSPAYRIDPVSLTFETAKTRGSQTEFSSEEMAQIKEGLKELNIKYDGTPGLSLVKEGNMDSIKVANNGFSFRTIKNNDANYIPNLKNAIQNYVQYKFLQTFSANDENVRIDVKLVPVINGKADTTKSRGFMKGEQNEFFEKDTVVLWIKNNSRMKVFVNVLDMQPDGIINAMLPYKRKRIYPEDLFINPGETRLFDKNPIRLLPPDGTEVFKVFASRELIDMESIATSRGAESRGGNLRGMEQIVKKSFDVGKRGVDIDNTENADGTTYDLVFQIKKR